VGAADRGERGGATGIADTGAAEARATLWYGCGTPAAVGLPAPIARLLARLQTDTPGGRCIFNAGEFEPPGFVLKGVSMKASVLRRACLPVLIALIVACSAKKNDEQAGAPAAPGAGALAERPGAEAGATPAPSVDRIVAAAAQLPRRDFEPDALVAALGRDPQPLFEWVRDQTSWAPYRGLLRGATGVMLDRVGSNLDRAILLGELLRRAGHGVRLVHAQLPEDRARELLAKVRPMPLDRRGLTQPESARALVRTQTDQLAAAVKPLLARTAASNAAALAALRDHWWIERDAGGGKWIAMDVLRPDARPGDALAAGDAPIAWPAGATMPPVPDADWHTVRVRLVVERYSDAATSEAIALDTTLRPAMVLQRPITLGFKPKPWPEALSARSKDAGALMTAAYAVNEWTPYLKVGDDLIVQSGFNDRGELVNASNESAGGMGAAVTGTFGSMGDALGGGGEVSAAYATAAWIDYDVQVPGQAPQHLRRALFDLIGPDARPAKPPAADFNSDDQRFTRAEALSSETDILLQPCDFTADFLAHIASRSIVANQAAFAELAAIKDPQKRQAAAGELIGRLDLWGPLPLLVLARSGLGRQPIEWFIDRPDVLNYRVSGPIRDAQRVDFRELIDIASNPIGVRAGAGREATAVRLEQGVADTVAEFLTLGSEPSAVDNTAAAFQLSGATGGKVLVVAPGNAGELRSLGWQDAPRARLAEDLGAGYAAVALREPVSIQGRPRLGWWRVDPRSGETIGVMDSGYHAALTEDEINRAENTRRSLFRWRVDQDHARMETIRARIARGRPVTDEARAALDLYDRVDKALWDLYLLTHP
jgi:hypothetical protein